VTDETPVTLRQAAALVGRPVGTVRQWAAHRRMRPLYRLRNRDYYRPADVRAAAASIGPQGRRYREREPTAEEVEALIETQLKRLPDWWWEDVEMTAENSAVREIPGFPGYFATADGRIWSAWRGGLRRVRDDSRLKPMQSTPSNGYPRVIVRSADGKKGSALVHRLVLLAFVGPCPDGCQACHNDGNRVNNAVTNLRWDTTASNHADRDRHGTTARGERNGWAKLTAADVAEIRRRSAAGETQEALGKAFGVRHASIGRILRGQTWCHVIG
jgi:hypothetical protein